MSKKKYFRITLILADENFSPWHTTMSLVRTWISDLPAELFEAFKVCKEVKQ